MRSAIALIFCVCIFGGAATAHAGFDSPLHPDGPTLLDRCPKLSNPIECSGDSASAPLPQAIPRSQYADHSCRWLRVMYLYHHATTGKPTHLKLLTGCSLWRADADYHIHTEHFGLPDSLQEEIEALADLIGGLT